MSQTLLDLRLLQRAEADGSFTDSLPDLAVFAGTRNLELHALLDARLLDLDRSILGNELIGQLPPAHVHRLHAPEPGRPGSSFSAWRARLADKLAVLTAAKINATRIIVPAPGKSEVAAAWSEEDLPIGTTVFAALLARGEWRLEVVRSGKQPLPATKPLLALVTPLPPDRSGIADYAFELIGELEKHYRLELIHPEPAAVTRVLNRFPVRDVDWFARNADRYDRILYQFGNSDFHHHMFPLLEQHPGIVTLHDAFLSGIVRHMEVKKWRPGFFSETLYRAHGYMAAAERWRPGADHKPVQKYPCSMPAIAPALRVIVHSDEARSILHHHYGPPTGEKLTLIPHLRAPLGGISRAQARQELGVDYAAFLVCSFGYTGMTKLNHRLLEAWNRSALASDQQCRLVFAGGGDDSYSRRLRRACAGTNAMMVGRTSEETYRAYLKAADMAVQLRAFSRGETSGAALDCIAAGLPLIVNSHGSLSEFPDDTVLKLPGEFADKDLAAALERLREDFAERERLSESAVRYLHNVHDPASIGTAYRDTIEMAYGTSATKAMRPERLLAKAMPPAPTQEMALVAAICATVSLPAPLEKRQIFFDVTAIARNDLRSGIERTVRNLLTSLLENPPAGFRIEPVRLSGGSLFLARQFTCRLLGIRHFPLDDEPAIVRPGDIYFMADLDHRGVPAHREFYRAMRLQGVRTAFMVHDLLPVRRPEFFPPHAKADHTAWLETVAEADLAIAVTRNVAQDMASWLSDHSSAGSPAIAFSHHGSDLEADWLRRPSSPFERFRARNVGRHPAFLTVGTVEPRKGHDDVLAAFERLWAQGCDAQLVVVGRKGFRPLPVIDKMRRHRENGRRLFWFQHASDGLLEDLYLRSACLLAPSHAEGFGLPVAEAGIHGLPVLARDIAVFREVAPSGSHFFPDTGVEAIAGSVRDWLADPLEKGHRVPDILTWSQSAANLVELLTGSGGAESVHHGWLRR